MFAALPVGHGERVVIGVKVQPGRFGEAQRLARRHHHVVFVVEIQGRRKLGHAYRMLDHRKQHAVYKLLVVEADFGLGGMDVDVDGFGLYRQPQEIGRIVLFRHQLLIGRFDGVTKPDMFDIACIDKQILFAAVFGRVFGRADEAVYVDVARGLMHAHEPLLERPPHKLHDALTERTRLQMVNRLFIARELPFDFGMRHGHAHEFFLDIAVFHLVGLEELPPRRRIEIDVLDADLRAVGTGAGLRRRPLLALHAHRIARFVVGTFGFEFHAGHGRDGRQSLPAEAHRLERIEVVGLTDFGRGVPQEAFFGILGRHPAAVVNNLYKRFAGVAHQQMDIVRPRVHGVFKQLLDRRGRPVDDLARRNLVGHMFR